MTDRNEDSSSEGTTPKSHEWVSGQGGPSFTEGGMMPGGDEMENWKKTMPNELEPEETVEQQAENLRERLDQG